jgi:mevalonate kinase
MRLFAMLRKCQAKAPGKLIVSGEHAVVHGAPAIACAINRYLTVSCETLLYDSCDIIQKENNLRQTYTNASLRHGYAIVEDNFRRYQQGLQPIDQVLGNNFSLAAYTCALFFHTYQLEPKVAIHIDSKIPIGCGMGSSAALILALLSALHTHTKRDINDQSLYQMALVAENRQHGVSSGIDLHTCLYGKTWLFSEQYFSPLQFSERLPMYWHNSGQPNETTGQCVDHTRKQFAQDNTLKIKFSKITSALANALQLGNESQIHELIIKNNILLAQLGVVPEPVQQHIKLLARKNISAKISGAGALTGKHAGCNFLFGHEAARLTDDLLIFSLAADVRGCHVVH